MIEFECCCHIIATLLISYIANCHTVLLPDVAYTCIALFPEAWEESYACYPLMGTRLGLDEMKTCQNSLKFAHHCHIYNKEINHHHVTCQVHSRVLVLTSRYIVTAHVPTQSNTISDSWLHLHHAHRMCSLIPRSQAE